LQSPYIPTSGSQLVQFVPSGAMAQPPVGSQDTAQIGLGDKTRDPCFRWNFYGFNIGCDSHPAEVFCEFIVSGYQYSSLYGFEVRVVSQTVWVPTCSGTNGCGLSYQTLSNFDNLTSILVSTLVNGEPRVWWMDDMRMGWTNNSCEAAFDRQNAPTREGKRGGHRWDDALNGGGRGKLRRWVRDVFGV
jgi:collagen type III alpha